MEKSDASLMKDLNTELSVSTKLLFHLQKSFGISFMPHKSPTKYIKASLPLGEQAGTKNASDLNRA